MSFSVSFSEDAFNFLTSSTSFRETYSLVIFRANSSLPVWEVEFFGNHAEMDAHQFSHFLKKKGFENKISSTPDENICAFCA